MSMLDLDALGLSLSIERINQRGGLRNLRTSQQEMIYASEHWDKRQAITNTMSGKGHMRQQSHKYFACGHKVKRVASQLAKTSILNTTVPGIQVWLTHGLEREALEA